MKNRHTSEEPCYHWMGDRPHSLLSQAGGLLEGDH